MSSTIARAPGGFLAFSAAKVIREAASRRRLEWQPALWLAFFSAVAIALVMVYPDSSSADGGTHFLEAQWAWRSGHHSLLVDVWGRPLFTLIYSLPAALGYRAAKLFTVGVSLAAAWQCWRVAMLLRFERPALVIPLLFLQPTFLGVAPETMTEPLFGLVLIVALRLHLEGRIRAGAVLASLLPLARPEGPFLVALWGVWIVVDSRLSGAWWRRIPSTFPLATGMVVWWLAALAITRDPLWIRHNAPWTLTSATASHGSFWLYWNMRWEILGPQLWRVFVVGMAALLIRRRALQLPSLVLVIFLLHSTMWAKGLMNTEGFPRYITCTAPAIALITLAGWNVLAGALSWMLEQIGAARVRQPVIALLTALVLLRSGWYALTYVDGQEGSRASWAIDDSYQWFLAHPRPVRELAWSRPYVPILFGWDPWETLHWTSDRQHNLSLMHGAPPGTLLFWDDATGPDWYHVSANDFAGAGFVRLRSKSYELFPLLPGDSWDHGIEPRHEAMHLFYKE
ncbi:MAG: hypothetical protein ABI446_05410 [Gemmatimonadaceae bacterium]